MNSQQNKQTRMTEAQMLAHKRAVDADRKALALNKLQAKVVLRQRSTMYAMARVAGLTGERGA